MKLNRSNLEIDKNYKIDKNHYFGGTEEKWDFQILCYFDTDRYFDTRTLVRDGDKTCLHAVYYRLEDKWRFEYHIDSPDILKICNFTNTMPAEDRELIIDMICEMLWHEAMNLRFVKMDEKHFELEDDWFIFEWGTDLETVQDWFFRHYSVEFTLHEGNAGNEGVIEQCIYIPEETAKRCSQLLKLDRLGKDEFPDTVIYEKTAHFIDGCEMDIKLCSGTENYFVDIVLFNKSGAQVCCDCGDDEYEGVYDLEYNGIIHRVVIAIKGNGKDTDRIAHISAESTVDNPASRIDKIIVENSWNSDEIFRKEMSLKEALNDVKESAYEDTDIDDYLTDNPADTVEDYVNHITNNALIDWINGYTYEYRGFTYQPILK